MARPIALITGASSGIGAALAREAAKDGYDVVLSARRVEPMQALAGELESYGAAATILAADSSKSGNVPDLVREIDQHGMAVDLLINNAGLGDNGAFAETRSFYYRMNIWPRRTELPQIDDHLWSDDLIWLLAMGSRC